MAVVRGGYIIRRKVLRKLQKSIQLGDYND